MEVAMNQTADKYEFRVHWQPFLLRPDMPEEGVPKGDGPRVGDRLKQAGQAVGIDFTGKCPVYPNTLNAHILLEMVKANHKLQNDLAEKLFKAYFTDGSSLDKPSLVQLGESVGLNKAEIEAALTDPDKRVEAYQAAKAASSRGVSGVPYFYINKQKTFSGAQEPATFINTFEMIAQRFPFSGETASQVKTNQ